MRGFIYFLNIFGACICGFGGAILWVAEGHYASTCASDKNKGLFNSTFWSFMQASQVIGSIMGAFLIAKIN
jgi:hypothetical protein